MVNAAGATAERLVHAGKIGRTKAELQISTVGRIQAEG